jgi:hypothetical protein
MATTKPPKPSGRGRTAKRGPKRPHAKRPRGRPPFEPSPQDRGTVEGYVIAGTPQQDIADILGISINTLRKHFAKELRLGMQKANAIVGGTMFKMITEDRNPAVAIFWAKTRMGWREQPAQEDPEEYGRRVREAIEAADKTVPHAAPRKRAKDDLPTLPAPDESPE